eukprot:1359786-Rhodomonas_salina.2
MRFLVFDFGRFQGVFKILASFAQASHPICPCVRYCIMLRARYPCPLLTYPIMPRARYECAVLTSRRALRFCYECPCAVLPSHTALRACYECPVLTSRTVLCQILGSFLFTFNIDWPDVMADLMSVANYLRVPRITYPMPNLSYHQTTPIRPLLIHGLRLLPP